MAAAMDSTARDRIPCPRCGKMLRLRTLAEKHVCSKKTKEPRKGRRMDPVKKLERQKLAAVRRFERRTGIFDTTLMDRIDATELDAPS